MLSRSDSINGWKLRRGSSSFSINVRSNSKVSFDPRFISSAKVEHDKRNKVDSMLTQFLRYKDRFDSENQLEKPDSEKEEVHEETRKYVSVYDVLPMLSFSKQLAEEYKING